MQLLMRALVLAAVRAPVNAAALARDEMPRRRIMADFAQSRLAVAGSGLCVWVGTALVWITHDLWVNAGLADHIAVMYDGRIVEKGNAEQVLDHPLHFYAHGLIGSEPSRNKRGERLRGIRNACHLNDR